MVKIHQIQCRGRSVAHRPGVIKKSVPQFSKTTNFAFESNVSVSFLDFQHRAFVIACGTKHWKEDDRDEIEEDDQALWDMPRHQF